MEYTNGTIGPPHPASPTIRDSAHYWAGWHGSRVSGKRPETPGDDLRDQRDEPFDGAASGTTSGYPEFQDRGQDFMGIEPSKSSLLHRLFRRKPARLPGHGIYRRLHA